VIVDMPHCGDVQPQRAISVTVTGISTLCSGCNLSFAAILWESGFVKRNFTIRRLLAILMIAGIALAPLSRPVMAEMSSDASMKPMADEMSPSSMAAEMASDMPCCPSKAPTPVGCDKCVFMAACTSLCFLGMSTAVVHQFLTASGDVASLQNDSWPEGLGHPPPDHPPRTLV
jgi:hypothetical protein